MARHAQRRQSGLFATVTLRWGASLLSCVAIIFTTGCQRGPRFVEVRGVVTLDGQPVAQTAVTFSPIETGAEPSVGITDEKGQFQLATAHGNQGAREGKHRVIVTRYDMVPLAPGEQAPSGDIAMEGHRLEWIVPKRYAFPDQSKLEVDVREGMPPVTLQLTRN